MVQISNLPSKPTNNQLASVNSGQNHSNFQQQQQHHFNNNLLVAAESSPMMLRPSEITSTRSHSISIFPSSVNSSEQSSLTSDLFPPPSQQSAIPAKQQQQQQPQQTDSSDLPEKQSYQQDQQQHSPSDSSLKNSNLTHHNYHHNFAHINLTSRQISRDKTEPIAHLDPRSIQTAESEAELHSSSSSAQKKASSSNLNLHLQHPTQPVITSVPTSILRESSGGSSAHGSYYELKQLQHNSGAMGAAGVRYLPKAPSSGNLEKRIIFDTGPPPPPPPPLPQFPLQAIRRRWSSYQTQTDPNLDPVDGIVALLSAIYCKIIVVIGLCFPMAEVISHRIPISWYEGFYLYLYTGSILFLIFVYIFLLNRKRRQARANRLSRLRNCAFRLCRIFTGGSSSSSKKGGKKKKKDEDGEVSGAGDDSRSGSSEEGGNGDGDDDEEEEEEPQTQIQCGSFYLRVGAVTFGVGSMIYSGLEFGQFFELESKEHCYSFMYGLTPGSHMIFTFIQLYFIFMNSRVVFARHKLIARFGLMHMIGTNICVWLHVLIQETKHQIMTMVETNSTDELSGLDLTHAWDHVDDVVEELSEDYLDSVSSHPVVPHRTILGGGGGGHHASMIEIVNQTLYSSTTTVASAISADHSAQPLPGLHRVVRSLNDHYITHSDCRRSNIIGELVTDASQFLFPCTIEYSLICAAILYIMWKSISEIDTRTALRQGGLNPKNQPPHSIYGHVSTGHHHLHHQKHHYQVDCAKAHKGLFTGIFLMVICIISLILFFVFIKKDQFRNLAVLQAHIVELFIYCINAIACLIALFQVRELNYNRRRGVELDNILLIIAQSGLCIFTMFSIIGAQFISQLQNTRLVLINAFACLIQSTLQSVFILDASKRKASTADQVRRKPGREMVTFLLVCNFSMWAINTLETRRAESNPVQMSFYGFWAWTIITHVTMPLTIFYRFHSTVCLCEIWKGTYKIKSEYL